MLLITSILLICMVSCQLDVTLPEGLLFPIGDTETSSAETSTTLAVTDTVVTEQPVIQQTSSPEPPAPESHIQHAPPEPLVPESLIPQTSSTEESAPETTTTQTLSSESPAQHAPPEPLVPESLIPQISSTEQSVPESTTTQTPSSEPLVPEIPVQHAPPQPLVPESAVPQTPSTEPPIPEPPVQHAPTIPLVPELSIPHTTTLPPVPELPIQHAPPQPIAPQQPIPQTTLPPIPESPIPQTPSQTPVPQLPPAPEVSLTTPRPSLEPLGTHENPMVNDVRKGFFTLVAKDPNRFHPKDIEQMRVSTWWAERFANVYKTYKEAIKELVNTMEWRKAFGIYNLNRANFPEQITKSRVVSFYPYRDRDNRPVIYFQMSQFDHTVPVELMVLYVVYHWEMVDRHSSNEGWAIVVDLTDITMDNIYYDAYRYLIDTIQTYYPRGPKYVAILDVPFYVKAPIYVLLNLFSTEMKRTVTFINKGYLLSFLNQAHP